MPRRTNINRTGKETEVDTPFSWDAFINKITPSSGRAIANRDIYGLNTNVDVPPIVSDYGSLGSFGGDNDANYNLPAQYYNPVNPAVLAQAQAASNNKANVPPPPPVNNVTENTIVGTPYLGNSGQWGNNAVAQVQAPVAAPDAPEQSFFARLQGAIQRYSDQQNSYGADQYRSDRR